LLTPEQVDKHYENRKKQERKITVLEKIEERRKKVYLLDLQGYGNHEISSQLGVSLSTIEKDLHYMKFYCVKWYRDLYGDGSGISLLETCSQIDIIQKELWDLYKNEKNPLMKKRFLDSIVSNSLKKREFFKGYSSSDSLEKKVKELEKEIEMNLQVDLE